MSYLIIANIYLMLFYLFYRFFLSKETFFQLNRIYLISTAVLSFIIPLVQLDWLQQTFSTATVYAARNSLDAVTIGVQPDRMYETDASGGTIPWWIYVYVGGCCIQLVMLAYRYLTMKRRLGQQTKGDAYSFMRQVRVDSAQIGGQKIREHEVIHAQQLHTIDLLFMEVVIVFNWFNPAVYYLNKSMRLVHEYIADAAINHSQADKIAYAELLIARTFGVSPVLLANNFFNQSLIKSRVKMLFKSRSSRHALFKYALAMPLFIAMLIFSSTHVSEGATELQQIAMNTTDMRAFYKSVAQHVRYQQEAKQRGKQGYVEVAFEKQGNMVKSNVLRTIGYGQGEEVERALRSPNVMKDMPEGKNILRIQFVLERIEKKSDPKAPIIEESPTKKTGYTNLEDIVIVGYIVQAKDQGETTEKRFPPPKVVEVQDTDRKVADFNKVEIAPAFPGE